MLWIFLPMPIAPCIGNASSKKSRLKKARFLLFYFLSLPNNAPIHCRLSLEMFCRLMSFGHSASQAYVLVQLPKPNSSILATMFLTRSAASIWPWGNKAKWLTLAPTNNMALAFLQAATQAPQPMHEAASMAMSALCFGIGIVLASGTPPVVVLM